MFVVDLSIENWVGNKDEGDLIENPNWQQIEAAIGQLDGKTRTLVTLGVDEDTYMSIGGGEDGKYIVTATFDNVEFYNSVDGDRSSGVEKRVVGGQLGTFPAKICVGLQTALLAAKTFAESGGLEGTIAWENSESLVAV